jgi:hypothetical protein
LGFGASLYGDGLLSRACREVYGKRDIIPLPIRIIGEVHLRQGREGLVHSKGRSGSLRAGVVVGKLFICSTVYGLGDVMVDVLVIVDTLRDAALSICIPTQIERAMTPIKARNERRRNRRMAISDDASN